MNARCSAPTSKRTPCQAAPFATGYRWSRLGSAQALAPSAALRCWFHLPPGERAAITLTEENHESTGPPQTDAENWKNNVLAGIGL